jgi:DsbC/DsbD-like thiol-disulfide interchange protein
MFRSLLLILSLSPGALAQESFFDKTQPMASVEFVTSEGVSSPGDTLGAGATLTNPEVWHLFWNGLNDSGLEPMFTFSFPSGITAGDVRWPAPKRKITAGMLLDHIYEDSLTLPFPLMVDKAVPPGTYLLEATINWLICKDVCISEEAKVTLEIRVQENPSEGGSPLAREGIIKALARVPLATPPEV